MLIRMDLMILLRMLIMMVCSTPLIAQEHKGLADQ